MTLADTVLTEAKGLMGKDPATLEANKAAFADYTQNPFHKILTKHGFVHQQTRVEANHLVPTRRDADLTAHLYTHPNHGKSHVWVWQYHDGDKPHFIYKYEQSNGIMAPGSGDTKPQLDKTLTRDFGEPK